MLTSNMSNLDIARYYLASQLLNQGIEWDEAQEEATTIERNLRKGQSDDSLACELHTAAARYEDM